MLNIKVAFASLLIVSGLFIANVSSANQTLAKYQLDIEAQPLSSALKELSNATGLEVLFFTDVVEGINVRGLGGSYTPEEALDLLLAGTDLILVYLDQAGTVAIRRKQSLAVKGAKNGTQAKRKFMEELIITGSHIRTPAENPVSPLITFTRQEIDRAGYATANEFIETIPQNFGGGISANTHNLGKGGFGGTAVNLRGLGNDATLVLLNGHRLAPASNGDYIDVSMIPLFAVERLEVLMDGASAIYGSDAVGGVVNFILRGDYEGAETRLRHGSATRGGRDEVTVGQTLGTQWDSGNAMLSYEYMAQSDLTARERHFTSTMNDPYDLLPKQERHSLFIAGTQQLTEKIYLSGDGFYSKRDTNYFQATMLTGEGRPDLTSVNSEQYGATLKTIIELSDTWRTDIVASYNNYRLIGGSRYLDDNTRAGPADHDRESTTWSIDAKADGSLYQLGGGDIRLAVGGHYRREGFKNPMTIIFSDVDVDESRNIHAFFGEMFIPIIGGSNRRAGLERLELTLAGRYEEYSDFGSSTDPKVGLLWSPVRGLNFRGTWGTSFRAPIFFELKEVHNAGLLLNIEEPESPTGRSLALVAHGENANLQPETATIWTVGADFQPSFSPNLNVGLTYFNIDFKDRIERPDVFLTEAFIDPVAAPLILENPTAEDIAEVTSGPLGIYNYTALEFPGQNCCGPVSDITDPLRIVDFRLRNNARSVTEGIDFDLSYDLYAESGAWNFSMNGTYFLEIYRQIVAGANGKDILNTYGNPVDLRFRGGVSWSRNMLSSGVYVNYVDNYSNDEVIPFEKISSWTTVDFRVAYEVKRMSNSFLNDTRFSFYANNLFDRDPPFAADAGGFVSGQFFDPGNSNALGRFVSLSITKRW